MLINILFILRFGDIPSYLFFIKIAIITYLLDIVLYTFHTYLCFSRLPIRHPAVPARGRSPTRHIQRSQRTRSLQVRRRPAREHRRNGRDGGHEDRGRAQQREGQGREQFR